MARNKYPEITVERILTASEKLFFEKGFENTTIADIVGELGNLSKGAIYHHFKSKEDIIGAILDKMYSVNDTQFSDIINSTILSSLEKIQKLTIYSLKNPSHYRMIELAPNLFKNPRFLAEQLYSSIYEISPMIEKLIVAGVQDGSISTNNPKELAELSIILLNIWLNPFIFTNGKEELRRKFVYLRELLANLGIPALTEEAYEVLEEFREIIFSEQERKRLLELQ